MSTLRRSVRNRAATVTTIVAVGAGGVGLAAAADPTSLPAFPGSMTAASQDEASETADNSAAIESERASRADRLAETLTPLVEDGSLTQEQADTVVATLVEAEPSRGRHGRGGEGRGLDVAAEALGLTSDELREELKSGESSLSDIAQAQGVDPEELIQTLVNDANDRIDERLSDGSLTQDDADELLASLSERITTMVQETPGERGVRAGRGGPNLGPSGDDSQTQTETEPDASTT
ncbi:MAG: hypothetical protein WA994_01520 [Ornithinimicrobium sp.]